MRWLLYIILTATLLSSCGSSGERRLHSGAYRLVCEVDTALHRDSAVLMVVEPAYRCLRVLDTVAVRDGQFVTQGHIDGDHVAILQWNNIEAPFYLVLGTGEQWLHIGEGGWRSSGNRQQLSYGAFLATRHRLIAERMALENESRRRMADSTLTADIERRLLERDSLLADSMQRLMQAGRARRDCVGDIIRSRFP